MGSSAMGPSAMGPSAMGSTCLSRRTPRRLPLFLLTLALAATLCRALDTENSEYDDDDDEYDDDFDNDDYHWEDDEEYYVEDEEWENPPNVTAEETDILSSVADYMSSAHHLLENVQTNKEEQVSALLLEEAWAPVKRDAVAVAAAAVLLPGDTRRAVACASAAEKDARFTLHKLQESITLCYEKSKPEFDPPWSESDDDDDEDDAEGVERAASEFLQLALGLLRATPLVDGAAITDMLLDRESSAESLANHAVMLERRARRRYARVRRCLDLLVEDTYKQADKAREALATCVLHMGVPPPGVDPKDEL